MSRHLQRQIEKLKKMILALGALVEESVEAAILAVDRRDVALAEKTMADDEKVDQMEIDVEEECLHTLALHQPVAFDLRYVVAVLKINNDLERIADLAVNICKQACFLSERAPVERVPFDLGTMKSHVRRMLKDSLDALVNNDRALAERVMGMDDQVDAIHEAMYNRLAEEMQAHPEHISQLINYQNISRQLERIADHAVNIAEDVIYLASGDIHRHGRYLFREEAR